MKYFRFAVLLFALFTLKASASPPSGYYLVWSDEFNGTSLDPTKWWVWNQLDRSGYTTPDAVTVTNGCMVITTYSTNGNNYSGIVSSDGRFRARYGYFEASVEFNGSPGMFSDFWLNSANNGAVIGDVAAEGAEVDVCEHRVTDATDTNDISGQVTIDLHWDGYTSGVEKSASSGLIGSGLGTGFHTYGFLWNNTNYSFSFDGSPVWSTNAGVSQRTEIVLFSCEVDSNSFCGIVPTNGYGNPQTSTTTTVVDYFRYYAPTTTVFWSGASSPTWSDGNNWLSNMIPTPISDVVFSYFSIGNYNITLDQPIAVNSLSIQESGAIVLSGNPITVNGGGIDMLSAQYSSYIVSPLVVGAAQSWSVASNLYLVVDGPVSGSGNLIVNGLGTVALEATNSCSGTMTVSSGVLQVDGLITNAVTLSGGTLTGSGTVAGAVTVKSGALSGPNTLTGPVVVKAGGTLAPGSGIGAVAISNTLALQAGSQTMIDINKSVGTCDQLNGLSGITYGGTLVINNQSGALAPGDTFRVFNAASYAGSFSRISPATPGAGLAWNLDALNANGVLQVISTSNVGATITAQPSGQQVAVSWPSNYFGWYLQTQTNASGSGLTRNWATVPGSYATNVMLVNLTVGSVFYRLACPDYSTAIFGAGDLIVLQVGNGSIASSGAPGVLYDFSPFGGAAVTQVSLPKTGSNALVFSSSSYEGALTLAADGRSVVIPGYNVPIGYTTSALDTSSTTGSTPVLRAVGSVTADGKFTLNATTTKFSGSTIRSATSDGNGNFWAGGGASGIVYLGTNATPATLSSVSSSTRDLMIANGNLCFTETGSGTGVMAFSGAPESPSTPILTINTASTGSGPSPKGSAINAALGIAYVADNRTASSNGGVQRFNWNGSSWVYAYTIPNNLTSSKVVNDIAVNFSGTNPILYAITGESTGNHLVTATDAGASSTFTSLATASSGNAFRGVTFAPTGH